MLPAAFDKAGIGLAQLPFDQEESGLERLCRVPDLTGELWLLSHPDLRNVRRVRAVWGAIVESVGAE